MIQTIHRTPSVLRSLFQFVLPRKTAFSARKGLPENGLRLTGLQVDGGRFSEYCEACGIGDRDLMPLIYPQVLASPLQLALLSTRSFPLRMLGAVHRSNRITQTRAIHLDQAFDVEVKIEAWRILEKGIEIDLLNTLNQGGEFCWESLSTFYVRGSWGRENASPAHLPMLETHVDIAQASASSEWFLDKKAGRRYARITGDYNPIHVSRAAARLFGFERDLAHGMYVLASALEKTPEAASEVLNAQLAQGKTLSLEVEFKGPNYLANDLRKYASVQDEGLRLDVYCANNPKPTLQAGLALG